MASCYGCSDGCCYCSKCKYGCPWCGRYIECTGCNNKMYFGKKNSYNANMCDKCVVDITTREKLKSCITKLPFAYPDGKFGFGSEVLEGFISRLKLKTCDMTLFRDPEMVNIIEKYK